MYQKIQSKSKSILLISSFLIPQSSLAHSNKPSKNKARTALKHQQPSTTKVILTIYYNDI
ncbi:hypothetical protein LPBF_10645 [Flavobacterium crassostreae]|uniref:Uncharacterized protein n=1 Tax=Flavobacterium crassostreae TaxID=1763534 RepID=A0A1B9DXM7_9FLAO|nr:hypothetical protein LPBF_10645 [Flavobacterium crassostreae]